MTDPNPPQGPLLRALASSSTARRRAAMAQLTTYLTSARRFTSLDMLKVWKALFYCVYMTPRPRNQQRLSIEISELALSFLPSQTQTGEEEAEEEQNRREDNLVLFLEAFWITIAREWEGIDKARLDKFLFLVRRMVYVSFETCKTASETSTSAEDEEIEEQEYSFSAATLARHVATLAKTPLVPRDTAIPVGLRLHVLDVLLDELAKADPEGKSEIKIVLAPVEKLKKETLTKTVKARASEVLGDERIQRWGHTEEVEQELGRDVDGEGRGNDDWDGFGD
ncbi:hypothetical protein ANO11243_041180 [Dothideomycetidae sp. 11243]|nr:hypothetical protein ANO11243_041180 [fungal sp. No.11243]